ncbi:MAG: hypothetical protein O3A51_09305, partial [Verrucomicrobia bacterium]|nr:hypothetical protein [Verrucomicrobiota bacterium]
RTLPDKPGVRRVYQLSYLAREQQEALFLSVMEEPSGTHYGTFCLGSLVRVFKPVVEVDAAGRVTVVHQVSQKTYARSLLESTEKGVRLVDQDYQQRSQESLPGLRRRATPEAQ